MQSASRRGLLLLGLSYLAFVSLGLPDGLLGVAWPSIRASFHLPLDSLGALLVATTIGYVSSAFASGRLLSLMLGSTLALFAVYELLAAVAPLTEGLREDRLVDVRQPKPDIHTTELHR